MSKSYKDEIKIPNKNTKVIPEIESILNTYFNLKYRKIDGKFNIQVSYQSNIIKEFLF
jgi:hypothetical protein